MKIGPLKIELDLSSIKKYINKIKKNIGKLKPTKDKLKITVKKPQLRKSIRFPTINIPNKLLLIITFPCIIWYFALFLGAWFTNETIMALIFVWPVITMILFIFKLKSKRKP